MEQVEWQSYRERLAIFFATNLPRIIFFLILGLVVLFFVVNWYFIGTLSEKYREVVDKEARLYTVAITENLRVSELNWAFAEILRKSEFPVIITDLYETPINWKNIPQGPFRKFLHPNYQAMPFYQLPKVDQELLRYWVTELKTKKPALPLEQDGKRSGYLIYGDLTLIRFLSWLPIVEVFFLLLFTVVAWYGFMMIRQSEQGLLWAALAKETAHQMGTPLSSLLGWMELLKMRLSNISDGQKSLEIVQEIEGDVTRLNQVSIRFSQIGSLPKLTLGDLNSLVFKTAAYFKQRLPQLGKKVELKIHTPDLPEIYFNRELIGWVIENLIKNALDSIKASHGYIKVETFYAKAEEAVHITVTDNGRGIDKENWKKIFNTGYSTKKRGWGLGLSLARRIVTIYHQGSIFVEWSSRYHGTQFRVILPIMPERAKKALAEEINKKL